MSKIKSPKEKKKLALARDRRNTYGENPEASRKGIRRGKQRRHREERRAVGHVLRHLKEKPNENELIEADVQAKILTLEKKRKGFRKRADEPLGVVIKRKLARRDKLEAAAKQNARVPTSPITRFIRTLAAFIAEAAKKSKIHARLRGWCGRLRGTPTLPEPANGFNQEP